MNIGDRKGSTLLELIIAMVVMSIVGMIAFYIYNGTVKNSIMIQRRFFTVSESARLKYEIDGQLKNIWSVKEIMPGRIKYLDRDSVEHCIECDDSGLDVDNHRTLMPVVSLEFDTVLGNCGNGVVWEAMTKDSVWIGGEN